MTEKKLRYFLERREDEGTSRTVTPQTELVIVERIPEREDDRVVCTIHDSTVGEKIADMLNYELLCSIDIANLFKDGIEAALGTGEPEPEKDKPAGAKPEKKADGGSVEAV